MSASSSPTQVPAYYQHLGVHPSITATALARHFKKLSLQWHPDRAAYRSDPAGEAEVQRRFQEITEAYNVLSDPQRRATYDTQHGVNFYMRVSSLQHAIERHNHHSMRKATRDGNNADDMHEYDDVPKRTRCESSYADTMKEESDSDDDDEYSPDHDDEADPSAPKASRRAAPGFSLVPSRLAIADSVTSGTILKGVTLRKDNSTASWGLEIVGSTLRRCIGHSGIPYPAVITQVNGRNVHAGQDVAAIIVALKSRDGGATAELVTDEQKGEELHLTLMMGCTAYDIIGNTDLLMNDEHLSQLVPSNDQLGGTELVSLVPGHTVLSVNDETVNSVAELRDAIRRYAREGKTLRLLLASLDDNAEEK